MKKYISALTTMFLFVNTILAKEITSEELDKKIISILLTESGFYDPPKFEIINKRKEYHELLDNDIRNSLYRIMNNNHRNCQEMTDIIHGLAISVLPAWGDESSIKELSKFIDDKKPMTRLTERACIATIYINDFETNFLLNFVQKCVAESKTYNCYILMSHLCKKYYKNAEGEKKQYYIKKMKLITTALPAINRRWINNLLKDVNLTLAELGLKEDDFLNEESKSSSANSNITNPAVAEKKGQEEKSRFTQNSDKKYPITMWAIVGFFTLALAGLGILCKLRTKKNN